MRNVAIVTDSSAGIPPDLIQRFGLYIVPIGVQINQRFYREGIDLIKEQFFAELDSAKSVSTSQPSPGDFLEVYKRAAKKAHEIISLHITSRGSGTVNVANLAKSGLKTPVTVVDSRTAGMAQGFMALAAAQAAQIGVGHDEILKIIERVREQSAVFVAVPTLRYLEKSGRIGSAKRLIASMLSIKPILGVKDGLVDVVEKARSYPKALQQLISLVEETFPLQRPQLAIMHSNAYQEAMEFKAKVEERLDCTRIFLAEMGASLAVHGGQGMLGIAAYSGQDVEFS